MKGALIKQYQDIIQQLISSAPVGSDGPPVVKDLELTSQTFSAISSKVQ